MAGLLDNLPSRGLLKGSGSLIQQPPLTYICDHDTRPPVNQIIKSSGEQILLNCLLRDKKKDKKKASGKKAADKEKGSGGGKESGGSRKRDASGQTKASNAAKKPSLTASVPTLMPQQLRAKSNIELSDMCKQLGIPHSGNKEVLVERISKKQASGNS